MPNVACIAPGVNAVAIQIAIFAPQFVAFALRSPVVTFAKFFAEFPAILRDFRFIALHVTVVAAAIYVVVANVAIISPIAVLRHQRAGACESHKNYS